MVVVGIVTVHRPGAAADDPRPAARGRRPARLAATSCRWCATAVAGGVAARDLAGAAVRRTRCSASRASSRSSSRCWWRVPLLLVALQVVTARDGRRFVVGARGCGRHLVRDPVPEHLGAAAARPRWSTPTRACCRPTCTRSSSRVNTIDRSGAISFADPRFALLMVFLVLSSAIVAYSAWVWRASLAEGGADEAADGAPGDGPRDRRGRRPSRQPVAAGRPDGRPAPVPGGRAGGRPRRRRHLGARSAAAAPGRREPPDDEAVVVVDLGRHARPAELLGPLRAGLGHRAGELRVRAAAARRRRRRPSASAAAPAAPRGRAARRPCSRGCRRRRSARRRPSPRAARSRTTRGPWPARRRRRRSGTAGAFSSSVTRPRNSTPPQPPRGDVPARLALLGAAADEQQPAVARRSCAGSGRP